MIPFKCGSCGNLLNAPDSMAGKIIDCPKCSQPLQIPPLKTLTTISPSKAKEDENGCLCFGLGFCFSLIGVLIAAVIGKTKGVKSALFGLALGTIGGVILALCFFFVFPLSTENFGAEARASATRSSINAIEQAARTYEIRVEKFPDSLDQLTQPMGGRPPLLDKKTLYDSWGVPFAYKKTNTFIEIRSAGPDCAMNTEDDLVNRAE